MKKGGRAKAPMQKPTEGKKDSKKPAGGEVKFGYAGKARKGKKAQYVRKDRAWKIKTLYRALLLSQISQFQYQVSF